MKKSKIIRKFERFMFHGVPERPEPTFQRNDHASYTDRHTGKSNYTVTSENKGEEAVLIGYLKEDFDAQKETFVEASSSNN
ncbi:MAG: hypothetical protein ED556_08170 [Winogradskyella sp.]|uniref:hypothetical protein n=1 Tax=Winogradskyella sp. TaxID=1883156 RepID=UPI000F3D4270|nr:hypothetical protein [Winogradskyella sp.]RNC86263.1 MAG: hypothetical protein ED556_08170 [Winogradskyella sp.]